MRSTCIEIVNRGVVGAIVVFLTMAIFDRGSSHAAIRVGSEAPVARKAVPVRRGPAPAMIGQPLAFEGDGAGQYASEAWRTYMNGLLAQMGYGPIDGCTERMQTQAFVFQADCSGEMVLVGGIYRATGEMIRKDSPAINVRTGDGLRKGDIVSQAATDIVDRSVAQRAAATPLRSVSAYAPAAAVSALDESVPILNAPVPQTRRRGGRE